jgi:hypothetical protein
MAARIVIKCIKIKNKKYHIVETFNRKIVERDTPNKQIHDSSSSWYRYRYFHKKVAGLIYFYGHPPHLLVILCGHASAFYKKASEIKHVNFAVDILVYHELKNVVQNLF